MMRAQTSPWLLFFYQQRAPGVRAKKKKKKKNRSVLKKCGGHGGRRAKKFVRISHCSASAVIINDDRMCLPMACPPGPGGTWCCGKHFAGHASMFTFSFNWCWLHERQPDDKVDLQRWRFAASSSFANHYSIRNQEVQYPPAARWPTPRHVCPCCAVRPRWFGIECNTKADSWGFHYAPC